MTTSDQDSVEPLLDDPDIVSFELARGGTAAEPSDLAGEMTARPEADG